MATEKLHVSKVPEYVIDRACDQIAKYSVGLSRVIRNDNKEDSRLIGSGTLVIVNGLYSILTADHVVAEIRKRDQISLLAFTDELRRLVFDSQHLEIHRIARGQNDAIGPDVAVIVLPQSNIGTLKGRKHFSTSTSEGSDFPRSSLRRIEASGLRPG